MAKTFKIYTCGAMSNKTLTESMEWRNKIEEAVRFRTDKSVTFIHPPEYFNYEVKSHKTEKEVMEWEISQIQSCDIVVANIDDICSSVGSLVEIGAVYTLNMFSQKHISVIGISKNSVIHPWIKNTCLRIEEDYDSAADYIVRYLLV